MTGRQSARIVSPTAIFWRVGTVRVVPLFEREHELAVLGERIAAAAEGTGAVVAVTGPPGIGKTSLLVAARGRAERAGLRCATARARELEREFSFGVVRQLFEQRRASAIGVADDRQDTRITPQPGSLWRRSNSFPLWPMRAPQRASSTRPQPSQLSNLGSESVRDGHRAPFPSRTAVPHASWLGHG